MSDDHKRPRIHSIGVHGIMRVQIERDAKYNELRVRFIADERDYHEFTVTVWSDDPGLPPVSIVDVEHALEAPSMVQESVNG